MKFLMSIFSLMLLSFHLHAMENVNKPEQKTNTENDKRKEDFGLITDENLENWGFGFIKTQRESLFKCHAPSEATLESYYKTHKIYESAKKNRPDLVDSIKAELLNLYLYEHCGFDKKEAQLKNETANNQK